MKYTKIIIAALVIVTLTTSATCKKRDKCPTVGKANWGKEVVKK